jgi:hypothetical protein
MSVCRKGFKCPFPFRLATCKIHKASALPAAASCAAQRVRADAFVVRFFSTFLLQHFFAVKKQALCVFTAYSGQFFSIPSQYIHKCIMVFKPALSCHFCADMLQFSY